MSKRGSETCLASRWSSPARLSGKPLSSPPTATTSGTPWQGSRAPSVFGAPNTVRRARSPRSRSSQGGPVRSRWSWFPAPRTSYPSSGRTWCVTRCSKWPRLRQLTVFVVDRLVVDAAVRRGDPRRHLAGLGHRPHQAVHECAIRFCRKPGVLPGLKGAGRNRTSIGVGGHAGPKADATAEAAAWQAVAEGEARLLNLVIPPIEEHLALLDVGQACSFVHGVAPPDLL